MYVVYMMGSDSTNSQNLYFWKKTDDNYEKNMCITSINILLTE